ncbi:hypothetical protein MPSEU_000479200 [Mayamaea pseudoterrestris]|nr:hypothetical protein MPSEU_000479200 [Mayamaea pseudoterrestris]
MTKTTPAKSKEETKSPTKANSSPVVRASPPRSSNVKQGKGTEARLVTHPVHPDLALQIITYEDSTERKDAYNFPLKDGIKNPHKLSARAKEIDLKVFNRRVPGTSESMLQLNTTSGEAYPRAVFVRKFPAPPTPAERMETMAIMEEVLRGDKTSKYPPPNIRKMDYNPTDRVRPLDDFFQDNTIEALIKSMYDFEVLNHDFATSYPELLGGIFGRPTEHRFARDLGRSDD